MAVGWELLTKVQEPLELTNMHAYMYIHMHVNTQILTVLNLLYPLELPWASGVSQCWCQLALCNYNFLAVFKTLLFLYSPVLGKVQQHGHSVNVVDLSYRGHWQ